MTEAGAALPGGRGILYPSNILGRGDQAASRWSPRFSGSSLSRVVHRAPLEDGGLRSCVHRSEHMNEYEPTRILGGEQRRPHSFSEIGVLDKVIPRLAQLEKCHLVSH